MDLFYRPVDIDDLHLEGNIFAAPMAGYSDRVTRGLALSHGADMAYTEMISAEALIRGSLRTIEMMKRADGEDILAVQLFGSSPDTLGRAAQIAAGNGADLLDLNAGCPVSKVTAKGAGAALPRSPESLAAAITAMKSSGLPVTVKLRLGWDLDEINWRSAAHAAVEAGVSAIGFHPRTRKQGYGGDADWSAIKEMVREMPVPIIGSGDLNTPESVLRMFTETSCAGVMIGRGGVGNPDIFRRIRELLSGEAPTAPLSPDARLSTAIIHLKNAAQEFGQDSAAREMKKHLTGYVKGWPAAASLRQELMQAGNYAELMSILDQFPRPSSR